MKGMQEGGVLSLGMHEGRVEAQVFAFMMRHAVEGGGMGARDERWHETLPSKVPRMLLHDAIPRNQKGRCRRPSNYPSLCLTQ
jgi:hypothetical protein